MVPKAWRWIAASTVASLSCVLAGCEAPEGEEATATRAGGEIRLRVVEDLRLGRADGPEQETFTSFYGVVPFGDLSFAVVDRRALRVHVYGVDGRWLNSFGSRGRGPGELEDISGLAAVGPDGIALYDARSRRVLVFSRSGEPLHTVSTPPGPAAPSLNFLFADRDALLVRINLPSVGGPADPPRPALVRLRAPGSAAGDTLTLPVLPLDPGYRLAAFGPERGSIFGSVPFAPSAQWTWHPQGFWLIGTGETYTVLAITPAADTARIIERAVPAVPVEQEEADEARQRTESTMVRLQPDWKWSAAPIPGRKAFFRGIFAATDGRIWVLRHVAAERTEGEADAAGAVAAAGGTAPQRWVEPPVYDVFEADGTYLGEARFPRRFRMLAASGDWAWSAEESAEGVPQVVRYRIGFGG